MTVHDVALGLPGIGELRDRCRSMAAVEAILNRRADTRHHLFDVGWAPGRELASRDNGAGDAYSVVFSAAGVYIRGFDHESPMSPCATDDMRPWPGVVDEVPEVFRDLVDEPGFGDAGTPFVTVCLWREVADDRWRHGEVEFPDGGGDPDGASYLFGLLVDGSAEVFADFASGYYSRPVDVAAVRHVFALRPLDQGIVSALNPDVRLADLAADLTGIGYPA